jgi:hypothetical protein
MDFQTCQREDRKGKGPVFAVLCVRGQMTNDKKDELIREVEVKFLENPCYCFVKPVHGEGALACLKCRNLCLGSCPLLEMMPNEVGAMTGLYQLCLFGTNIHELQWSSVSQLTNLQFLSLRDCKKILELPDFIECMTSLTEINVSGSGLCVLPDSVCNLPLLLTLSLRRTGINFLPPNLVGMTTLTDMGIDAAQTPQDLQKFERICELTNLMKL